MNWTAIKVDVEKGWSLLMAITRTHPKTMTAIYVVAGGLLDHFVVTPGIGLIH